MVARDGLQAAQTELQVVRDELQSSQNELQSSQNELRVTREELRAARDELGNKAALLDRARREASEAMSSIERLTEECHGLRGDLQRQETLVVQRDGAIASLRDEAYTQWASGWLAFQRLLMPTRAWTLTLISLVTRRQKSPFSPIVLESQPPRLRPAPLLRLLLPLLRLTSELLCIILLVIFFFFMLGFKPRIYVMPFSRIPHFLSPCFFCFLFFFILLP